MAFASGNDLWVAGSNGKSLGRVTSGGQSPRFIRWAKKSSSTVYFLNRDGELRYARASANPFGSILGGGGGEPSKVSFTAKMTVKRDEEFAEMFTQGWRALSDGFYDPNFNGVDWKAVRAKYAAMVPHCATREDLYAMMGMMRDHMGAGSERASTATRRFMAPPEAVFGFPPTRGKIRRAEEGDVTGEWRNVESCEIRFLVRVDDLVARAMHGDEEPRILRVALDLLAAGLLGRHVPVIAVDAIRRQKAGGHAHRSPHVVAP